MQELRRTGGLLIRVSSLDIPDAEHRGTSLDQAWVGIDTDIGFSGDPIAPRPTRTGRLLPLRQLAAIEPRAVSRPGITASSAVRPASAYGNVSSPAEPSSAAALVSSIEAGKLCAICAGASAMERQTATSSC